MTATLYAVPASHPCACVERALQLKAIEYRRIDVPPLTQKVTSKLLFGRGTVPGLALDGRRIIGSRPIIRALEDKVPAPRLLPADERERKSVELAEEWGDEVLQPLVRRILWLALRRAPETILSYSEGSKLFVPAPVARLSAPLVARASQRVNAATEPNVRADLAHLDRHLARVDRWIAHEVIGGAEPNAADLQIGSGLALLLTVEDVAARFDGRPAAELAFKWFPRYPGRVPGGVLPAAWLR